MFSLIITFITSVVMKNIISFKRVFFFSGSFSPYMMHSYKLYPAFHAFYVVNMNRFLNGQYLIHIMHSDKENKYSK